MSAGVAQAPSPARCADRAASPPLPRWGRGIHFRAAMNELTSPGGKVRLFVEQPLGESARVTLGAAQAHYLLHVIGAHVGDRASLFNGRDGEWLAEIAEATRRDCLLACKRKTQEQTKDDDLWLVFAPIKKT